MFLEMDEEDLAESEELGLDTKSIHDVLQLQADLEALEVSHHNGKHPADASTNYSRPEGRESTASQEEPNDPRETSSCSSSWTLPCVSVDKDGNSYFAEKTVRLGAGTGAGIGALSAMIPTTGLKFRETPGDYDFDFHTAPARQLIVSLDAAVDIEVTDGTRKVFQPGTVMLAEDTWGKGHRSRAVDGKPRKSLFIVLPDNFKL
ncbi:unnamed protein product [Ascophyllum nodosum]